jgi:hypothetical protein
MDKHVKFRAVSMVATSVPLMEIWATVAFVFCKSVDSKLTVIRVPMREPLVKVLKHE